VSTEARISRGRWRPAGAVVATCLGTSWLALLMGTALAAQGAAVSRACESATLASSDGCPAKRLSGTVPPPPPPNSIGWTEETMELDVDAAGRVVDVTRLQGAEESSLVAPAVTDWTFRPALDRGSPVRSHVLVAAMFRPPVVYDAPAAGAAAVALAAPSSDVPVPIETTRPPYPALAVADAVVLVEVLVGANGGVQAASVASGSPGFADAALSAARAWSFRPAGRNGRPVPTYAYLVFGFRRPLAN
jgi:TonB family protein